MNATCEKFLFGFVGGVGVVGRGSAHGRVLVRTKSPFQVVDTGWPGHERAAKAIPLSFAVGIAFKRWRLLEVPADFLQHPYRVLKSWKSSRGAALLKC